MNVCGSPLRDWVGASLRKDAFHDFLRLAALNSPG